MSDRNTKTEDDRADEQEEFLIDIEDVTLHPALKRLEELRTDRTEKYRRAPLTPALPFPPLRLLRREDAEAAGQPEHAGTLLSGHELLRVARQRGTSEWKACNADIPPDVEPAEFVYRRFLRRLDLSFGQMAVVGGMLQQYYEKQDEEKKPAEKTRKKGHIEKKLLRAGRKVVEDAPYLVEEILRQEINIQGAVQKLKERSSNWTGPSPESVSLRALLLGEEPGEDGQMGLLVGRLRLQYNKMTDENE